MQGYAMSRQIHLTGHEQTFGEDEIIVSKTDTRGHITYANRTFQRVAQYSEAELLGKAHSIVRHPDMPRCVFKYLWDTIGSGQEVFAYVVNRCKSGDHYWVFAHVTPSYDDHGTMIGYHSNRRVPNRKAVNTIKGIYDQLLQIEKPHRIPREAVAASLPVLVKLLEDNNTTYEEFIFTLAGEDIGQEVAA